MAGGKQKRKIRKSIGGGLVSPLETDGRGDGCQWNGGFSPGPKKHPGFLQHVVERDLQERHRRRPLWRQGGEGGEKKESF